MDAGAIGPLSKVFFLRPTGEVDASRAGSAECTCSQRSSILERHWSGVTQVIRHLPPH